MQQSLVVEGKPADPSQFDAYEADGIQVYVRKGIVAGQDGLHIGLMKLLFLVEMLTVEGIAA